MSVSDFFQLYLSVSLKAAMILLLASSLHWLLPKAAAATKHLWWTVALCACLGLPLLTAVLPVWRLSVLPAAVANTPSSPVAPTLETKYAPQWDLMSFEALPKPVVERSAPINWAAWLAALWALGVWLVVARVIIGLMSIGLIKRNAQPLEHEAWRALVVEAATALRLRQRVRLCLSEQVSVPLTTGIVRPLVLLPTEALQWSRAQLKAVLLHELAHIKRRDCLTQMLASLACALYWCNPLVWFAAQQLRKTREQACDDEVLAAGTRASEYASCLVNVAQSVDAREYASPVAVGMACSQLAERITAILNPALNRRKLTWRIVMLMVLLVSSFVLPLAAFEPYAQAAAVSVPTPLQQSQDVQKQQREVEKHLREIEKHHREINEVHKRESEKHMRELERLQSAALSAEMKAKLEAELKRAADSQRWVERELETRLHELRAQEMNLQRQQQAELEMLQQRSAQDAQHARQAELERALQAQQEMQSTSKAQAELLIRRAQLEAELQQVQGRYKETHPNVIEQREQLEALTRRIENLNREAAERHLSEGRVHLEMRLAELEAQLKASLRTYTVKHPNVQVLKDHIRALQREIELLRK